MAGIDVIQRRTDSDRGLGWTALPCSGAGASKRRTLNPGISQEVVTLVREVC